MTDYRDFQPSPRPRPLAEPASEKYVRKAAQALDEYDELERLTKPIAVPRNQTASCSWKGCTWKITVQGEDAENKAFAALHRHAATHYDPVSRREDGPGIAKLQKPKPDYSVWGALDVDLLCADE